MLVQMAELTSPPMPNFEVITTRQVYPSHTRISDLRNHSPWLSSALYSNIPRIALWVIICDLPRSGSLGLRGGPAPLCRATPIVGLHESHMPFTVLAGKACEGVIQDPCTGSSSESSNVPGNDMSDKGLPNPSVVSLEGA